jgi:hypothetical protein
VRRIAELQLTTAFDETLDDVVQAIARRRADAVRDRPAWHADLSPRGP